ncbi:hypothetical protein [Methylorubrum extorquens]|jgi:hypothetical protein|uniref:hypothetical protein n=1 Tax=Methylorubrum extorquens TaxID=408 RepID=UPI0011BDA06D|nr:MULTISPECIES: hypothetical protein [Methylobacteriaceae]MCP1537322.1 hypothetical protein [Methylorubrum extorquens]
MSNFLPKNWRGPCRGLLEAITPSFRRRFLLRFQGCEHFFTGCLRPCYAPGTDWQIRQFVTISPLDDQTTIRLDDVKEAPSVPAQKKTLVPGIAQAKAVLEAAARLVSALSPQPVLQPIPVRVKSVHRR